MPRLGTQVAKSALHFSYYTTRTMVLNLFIQYKMRKKSVTQRMNKVFDVIFIKQWQERDGTRETLSHYIILTRMPK